jgi:hypothetical protein
MESWLVDFKSASSTNRRSFDAGGSLTAWGVTKTKDRFKAAVVGAGVSDWEGMVMSASSPELEVSRFVCHHMEEAYLDTKTKGRNRTKGPMGSRRRRTIP